MKYVMVAVLVSWTISCATAGGDDDGHLTADATAGFVDAPISPLVDANRSFPDASVPKDAPIVTTPDASTPIDAPPVSTPDAGGGGLFCTTNSNCGAGTCCFLQLCVPGTVDPILGCIPDLS